MIKITINKTVLELTEGNITEQETDAIVSAANSSLLGGGGVDGAIHRAGGPAILEACKKLGGCPTGEARITTGGNLKAKYVIHTVGPVYHDGKRNEPELLAKAYKNSLALTSQYKLRSVAFPSVSTGAYGYPLNEAAMIALKTVIAYLETHTDIQVVRFVLFNFKACQIYENTLKALIQ
ncbi:MAG: O-acetyl-ADP-ribose deacetylase [Candidatus Brocadia sp. WS118]|nr:MAG: O-acetyl-ADP-ribose deacetylase [Candidatus Brocadia sp. WS118]